MILVVSAWWGAHNRLVVEGEYTYPTGRSMTGVPDILWASPSWERKARPIWWSSWS